MTPSTHPGRDYVVVTPGLAVKSKLGQRPESLSGGGLSTISSSISATSSLFPTVGSSSHTSAATNGVFFDNGSFHGNGAFDEPGGFHFVLGSFDISGRQLPTC